jgi:uncharacterized protein YybS (DUF2232 family)
MSKNDSEEWTMLFLAIFFSIIVVFLFVFDKYYSPKLTEQYYYNKFCPKYYDVSCDNINLK